MSTRMVLWVILGSVVGLFLLAAVGLRAAHSPTPLPYKCTIMPASGMESVPRADLFQWEIDYLNYYHCPLP